MLNDALRSRPPVWSEAVDDGGMFATQLSVHQDPDGVPLPFLAVCRTAFGGGAQARRATLDEAVAYARQLRVRQHGV